MTQNLFAQRVAGNVRAEMARLGVTQQALARKLNRTQQSISRRLSGQTPFDVQELDLIATALGVPVATLLVTSPAAVAV